MNTTAAPTVTIAPYTSENGDFSYYVMFDGHMVTEGHSVDAAIDNLLTTALVDTLTGERGRSATPDPRIEREAHFFGLLCREQETERQLVAMLRRPDFGQYERGTQEGILTALGRSTARIAELRSILRSL